MNVHLTADQIDDLVRHILRGAERVAVLRHLESCFACRLRVPLPTRAEIMRRLDDDPADWKDAGYFKRGYGH